jgi:DNA-binding HxlR family transcriptional regulator
MTAIKESSTINVNKRATRAVCPVSYVISKLGGNWKPLILFQLMNGPKRYSELKRAIPAVTEKMLIQHLKELHEDGLINRHSENVVPPVVTYSLSADGEELGPMMDEMVKWAEGRFFAKDGSNGTGYLVVK